MDALRTRVATLEADFRNHVNTTRQREWERDRQVNEALAALRADFQVQAGRMHEDNMRRFDEIHEDGREMSDTVKAMATALQQLMQTKHRFEGGLSVLQSFAVFLRSGVGKLWLWLMGLGWVFTQVTPEKLDMLYVWLFGSK